MLVHKILILGNMSNCVIKYIFYALYNLIVIIYFKCLMFKRRFPSDYNIVLPLTILSFAVVGYRWSTAIPEYVGALLPRC